MDFWINLGISAVLQILAMQRTAKPYYRALAKIYGKIALVATTDKDFADMLDAALIKEGVAK